MQHSAMRVKTAGPEKRHFQSSPGYWCIVVTLYLLTLTAITPAVSFGAASRIKDLVKLEGISNNKLVGYGIIVGLAGTGDRNRGIIDRTMANVLKAIAALQVDATTIRTQNAAAVMVTAELPPFAKSGDAIDVVVSSIGDASSIEGGTLLLTPLKAPDGKIYAMAQGTLSIGGANPQKQAGRQTQRNHPSAGRIPSGALVHKSLDPGMEGLTSLTLILHRPDFTTATRIMNAVNSKFGDLSSAADGGTVKVLIPDTFMGRPVEFFAQIGALTVVPDEIAKIVINERTGTVIMGSEVKLLPVAIAHGNISVTVQAQSTPKNKKQASGGKIIKNNLSTAEGDQKQLLLLDESPNLKAVVDALNAIGATPRDLIAILQALREAGALQAELEVI